MDAKSTLEDVIEDYLVTETQKHGGRAYKLRPPKGRGFPDRTLVLPDNWVAFVEVKRPKGGAIARQQKYIANDLRKYGQRTYVVKNHEEVDQIFLDYKQRKHP